MLLTQLDAEALSGILPGTHVVLLSKRPLDGIKGRHLGLELRDTLLVLRPDRPSFAFLFRKPLEGTVAENVLRYGTSGLHIDACRVGVGEAATGRLNKPGKNGWKNASGESNIQAIQLAQGLKSLGRWPPNLVLIHHAECMKTGFTKIPGHKGYPFGPGGKSHQYSSNKRSSEVRPNAWKATATDPDGLETIASWTCHETCPVRELDRQSLAGGMRSAGNKCVANQRIANRVYAGVWAPLDHNPDYHADAGGASRFFPQFKDEPELHRWLRRLLGEPE